MAELATSFKPLPFLWWRSLARALLLSLLLVACGNSASPPEPPAPQDLAAAADMVEYELIGVKRAGDNEAVLAGVSTSEASVPKNSAVEFVDGGNVEALIDPMVALVVGKEMVAGAGGIARPRVMGDTGAILGANQSASPIVLSGASYAEIAIDIREPA